MDKKLELLEKFERLSEEFETYQNFAGDGIPWPFVEFEWAIIRRIILETLQSNKHSILL